MAETVERKPPLPVVQTFLPCHDIFLDHRTKQTMIIGTAIHIPATQFPNHVRLSLFTEFTGCRGIYQPRLTLRNSDDEVVWGLTPPPAFEQQDPLKYHQHTFHDLMVAVPRPGRYLLVLLLNDEEAAQRRISFGPK